MSAARDVADAGVVVLGAGPGGYAAAFRAADLGLDVTLVDPEPEPGGVCLFRGCIPSKALLHQAALIDETAAATARGITFGPPAIDLARLRAWKDGVVESLTRGLGQLAKSRRVRRLRGRGVFLERDLLEIATDEGKRSRLRFRHCVIATGSRPAVVPGLDTESPLVMNSTEALALPDVPGRLLVVGGGYIGLELATVYAALGSRVTVVEMTPALLAGADRDLVRVLAKRLDTRLEAVLLETKVAGCVADGDRCRVVLERAAGTSEEIFDRVLVATGRRPNSSGIGLKNTAVTLDARGFVVVDAQRRTAESGIFAIGDVAGEPMLAHKATHEGIVAAEVIAGHAAAFEPAAVPAVVYTDPEIAWCGVSEEQAKRDGLAVQIGRFPWAASGRALTLGRGEGLTKLVIDAASHRVLGAGVVGAGAGDLVAEIVLAIEMGSVAEDLALTIHPHPTLSETVMEAAEVALGRSVHLYVPPSRRGASPGAA
jgi:dihydrolipoamide dehydrogenase